MKVIHRIPTDQYAYIEVQVEIKDIEDTQQIVKTHKTLLDGWAELKASKQTEDLEKEFSKFERK